MMVSVFVKAILGCLIGLYLVFSGWMILTKKQVFIPFHIMAGSWLSSKFYGERFAEQERRKFIDKQLSHGKPMIIIGFIVILLSLFPLLRM